MCENINFHRVKENVFSYVSTFCINHNPPSEDAFRARGQYFKYLSLNEQTQADLVDQAKQLYIRRERAIDTDHDEYGSYTSYYTHCIPLTDIYSLSDNGSPEGIFGDVLVADGRIVGVILYIGDDDFGSDDPYKIKYINPLSCASRARKDVFSIIYTDGSTDGEAVRRIWESTRRYDHDYTDMYALTSEYVPDSHRSEW